MRRFSDHRYHVEIRDADSDVVRHVTVRLGPVLGFLCSVLALPVLIGMGARWSAKAEIDHLRATSSALEAENASYRAVTAELTAQIGTLQSAVTELGVRSTVDQASAKAMERLPALLKARAMGGGRERPSGWLVPPSFASPEDTFGMLRDLLGRLESRLRHMSGDLDRRNALAAATPSIWPAHGWLSATYGQRRDPFTGDPDFHAGLDISTDKGQPVYATAAGVVDTAAYSGAYGNMVVIDHGFGLTTRYAHLSAFRVTAGARVKRGHIIGVVGATGRATGAHLHYEVLANGKLLNPLQLLLQQHRP